jgi:hypothetical protein
VTPSRPETSTDLVADPVADQRGDLAWFCVPTEVGLREQQLVVERDLEPSLGSRHQLDRDDQVRPSLQQLVRQTDGTRDVVSGHAELDADAVALVEHRGLPVGAAP